MWSSVDAQVGWAGMRRQAQALNVLVKVSTLFDSLLGSKLDTLKYPPSLREKGGWGFKSSKKRMFWELNI